MFDVVWGLGGGEAGGTALYRAFSGLDAEGARANEDALCAAAFLFVEARRVAGDPGERFVFVIDFPQGGDLEFWALGADGIPPAEVEAAAGRARAGAAEAVFDGAPPFARRAGGARQK